MLKLIILSNKNRSGYGNLNTSHVKVNLTLFTFVTLSISHLNTSHVKVNLESLCLK